MANRNVYLPDDLAEQVKALDLNVSVIVQEALRTVIEKRTEHCTRCGQPLTRRRKST
jgi:post-segregation antitoxin (ccd killing protein)